MLSHSAGPHPPASPDGVAGSGAAYGAGDASGGAGWPGHLDLEEIAAFVEGRLGGAERERVLAHLASCEDCYEVYAGVASFADEEAAATAVAPAYLPFELPGEGADAGGAAPPAGDPSAPRRERSGRGRRRGRRGRSDPAGDVGGADATGWLSGVGTGWRWVAAAAAAAIVVVGLSLARAHLAPSDGIPVERIVQILHYDQTPIANWGHSMRGGSNSEPGKDDLSSDQEAFRYGVARLDLWLALQSNDVEGAKTAVTRVYGVLDRADLAPKEAKEGFENIGKRLGEKARPRSLTPIVQDQERLLQTNAYLEYSYVALGTWTEACRLSADLPAPPREIFESRDTRHLIAAMNEHPPLVLSRAGGTGSEPAAGSEPATTAAPAAAAGAATGPPCKLSPDQIEATDAAKLLTAMRQCLDSGETGKPLAHDLGQLCVGLLKNLYGDDD